MYLDNIDLEHFPVSESAKKMLSYVTKGWYDESYVGKWIFQVIGAEMDIARGYVEGLKNQAFPEICSWGMYFHEIMYGLPVDRSKDIDERRKAVLNRKDRTHRTSVTPYRIEDLIFQVFGLEASVSEQISKYTFSLNIMIGADYIIGDTDEIISYIRKIKPSHLSIVTYYVIEAAVGKVVERFYFPDIEVRLSVPSKIEDRMSAIDVKLEIANTASSKVEGNVMIYENLVQWNGEYSWNGEVKFDTEIEQEDL